MTIINAAGSSRVMEINSTTTVIISDVTIQGRNAGANRGGGIFNNGTLILTNSTVSDNIGANGGTILRCKEGVLRMDDTGKSFDELLYNVTSQTAIHISQRQGKSEKKERQLKE